MKEGFDNCNSLDDVLFLGEKKFRENLKIINVLKL